MGDRHSRCGRKIWFGIVLLALFSLIVPIGYVNADFVTKAEYAILIDVESNSVLLEKKADDLMAPASMSKLVTLGVIFKALRDGRVTLDDEFFISENAWRNGGAPSRTTAMFAKINSNVKVRDLIRGLIIQSGNDAAIATAEGLSGSEAAFVAEMQSYARRIGLKRSTFANPTGLPNPGQLMTARELAALANHIIVEYPEYYPIFSEKFFQFRRFKFYNRNPLLSLDIGVDGLKTGFTKKSGYGLVVSAVREGRRYILVINGLRTKRERKSEAQRLLNWGIRNFKPYKLFGSEETVGLARVWGGSQNSVKLGGNGRDIDILLPRSGKSKLKAAIEYMGPLKPPIKKGDQIAFLKITVENSGVSRIPLYAQENIEPGSLYSKGMGSLFDITLGWLL